MELDKTSEEKLYNLEEKLKEMKAEKLIDIDVYGVIHIALIIVGFMIGYYITL